MLSRELAEFLMDLSVAIHKHAIYPAGHPLLDQAVDSVHRGIAGLLYDRPALSIGVARRQLIIEGVATDSSHPVLAELAGKLHRHHLGAIKFLPGLVRTELGDDARRRRARAAARRAADRAAAGADAVALART